MTSDALVARFRAFLLALAFACCAGVVAELALTEHTKTPIQLAPFVVCGAAMLAIALAWARPNRRTLWALRAVMIVTALIGFLGVYEHLASNFELAAEVNAAEAAAAPLAAALTGANPALAPGALGVTALIALAATYYHPALKA